MTRSLGFLVTTCTCALLLSVSTVRAAGTSMVFSGAVVESTCEMGATDLAAAAFIVADAAQRHVACPGTGTANAAIPSALRSYGVTVSTLPTDSANPLLKYFASYGAGANANADSHRLVTMTYE